MAAMRAGDLSRRVVILKRTDTQDSYGEPVPAWTTFATRWAAIEPLSASERFTEEQELSEVGTRIRMRHCPGVMASWRVLEKTSASTTLSAAVASTSATTITVASATRFPADFNYLIRVGDETMRVTAGFGTTSWTVTRGVHGTTAATHANAATVHLCVLHEIVGVYHPSHMEETHLLTRQPGPTWKVEDA